MEVRFVLHERLRTLHGSYEMLLYFFGTIDEMHLLNLRSLVRSFRLFGFAVRWWLCLPMCPSPDAELVQCTSTQGSVGSQRRTLFVFQLLHVDNLQVWFRITITTSQAKGTYYLASREVQGTISAEEEEEQCVAWKVRGGWECRVMSAFGRCFVSI